MFLPESLSILLAFDVKNFHYEAEKG